MKVSRYWLRLAYNGSDYSGWQRQLNAPSVQQELEECLHKLYGNTDIFIVGCGRTDAGVHAFDFVAHVDLPETLSEDRLLFKLNRMTGDGIVVHEIKITDSDFHARFDATKRTYRYFINTKKDPFHSEQSYYLANEPNWERMNEAAKFFLGKKDFTSLSKLHTDVKTNICEVSQAEWVKIDDHRYYFEITANRFLRNMVRATVGTLLDVGSGKMQPEDVQTILEKMARSAAGTSVPGHALFLWKIEY